MRDLLFGTPSGWQLEVWLVVGDAVAPVVSGVVLAGMVWVLRRARRQARWPDGKP